MAHLIGPLVRCQKEDSRGEVTPPTPHRRLHIHRILVGRRDPLERPSHMTRHLGHGSPGVGLQLEAPSLPWGEHHPPRMRIILGAWGTRVVVDLNLRRRASLTTPALDPLALL